MNKVVHSAGRAALIVLGAVLAVILLMTAIGAMRDILPTSFSYLPAPLILLMIGLIRTSWPKYREQLRQRSTIERLRKIGEHKPYGAPPDELGFVNRVMGKAAELPLMDAAYHLWIHKGQLDCFEGFIPPPKLPSTDWTDSEIFRKVVQTATHDIQACQEDAHFGTTFLRLEKLYPEASMKDLQRAVRTAVKLDMDCSRSFSYESPHYLDDVTRAVEAVKVANPGFQEATYEAAWIHLATRMR